MSDTYAACLTPPGTAAIAVIAVRGPRAPEIVQVLFRPLTPRSQAESGNEDRFYLGRFGIDAADEVVLSIRRTVPVPWLELHCHGGGAVVRMVLDLLASRGAQVCTWQELERLTTDNPLRSAALAALVQACTVRTAAILLDQSHGAFASAVGDIVGAYDRLDPVSAGLLLEELAGRIPLGLHLVEPWRVVVAGAPNVGKSSLVNALAGYQRSIVSAIPGTTRDLVATTIAVDGWPVELIDTAGIRAAATALEEQGIHRARAAIDRADLCLWLLDGAAPPVLPTFDSPRLRFALTKADLPRAWDRAQAPEALPVSAITGAGIPGLCFALAHWLVPSPPPPGSAVPFTADQVAALAEAMDNHRACRFKAADVVLRRFLPAS